MRLQQPPVILSAVIISTVIGLCGASGYAFADDTSSSGVYERDSVEVSAPKGVTVSEVHIDNRLGNVSVRGHDQTFIQIQSFKRADDRNVLERLVVSLIPDGQGRVRITTALRPGSEAGPVRGGSIAIDLVVFVPRKSAIHAQLWNGQLRVRNVDNGANLTVDEGYIDVKQVSGKVVSHMRRGEQAFIQLFGELDAKGVEGSLHLDTVHGSRLRATLVRGPIKGGKIKVKEMQIHSVFGDIDLVAEFVPGGNYDVFSKKGDVSLQFHGQTFVTMTVEAPKTMLGPELSSRLSGPNRWQGQFGIHRKVRPAQLEVRTSTGSVTVKHF